MGNNMKPITVEAIRHALACCDAGDVPDYAQAIYSYLKMDGYAVSAPAPAKLSVGAGAIRKAGSAAVQKLVDRFSLTHFMPGEDDLTDHLNSIVDACVRAATEKPE